MRTWTPIWVARSSCTSSVQLRLIVCSESLPAGGPGSGVVIPTTVLASAPASADGGRWGQRPTWSAGCDETVRDDAAQGPGELARPHRELLACVRRLLS